MSWKPRQTRRNRWRAYLTEEELATIKAIDTAKAHWMKLNKERADIVNRATKRAANAALKKSE